MQNELQVRRAGAALLAATGVIHLVLAPEYLGERAYVGIGFILGGIAALLIATRLWRERGRDQAAWTLGALLCAGMAVGFVLSRTVGLPGFHESEWELSGIVSVLLEIGFVGCAATALRAPRSAIA
jgi:hypothetical protein